ncbi:hypothetical protein [Peloplasma aerotolerans]|uniref:Uncharacterized protein n=1 Tax=Peloplasma aerotolerans TaxID=3044389 RepID=A0AAW6UCB7_9MOLU|nr:hypothetical protein [Mariniplasma sp. M4Ah]MDI6453604.1 hypothetical protein [Mariniplasma sp. M4Ah]
MRKYYMFYIIFSFIFLTTIYVFTIAQESNKRSLALFNEIMVDAVETNDLEKFIKYQSVAYQKLDQINTTEYSFHVYHVIAFSEGGYINQFSIFTVPQQEVDYALDVNDESDLTSILIINEDNNSIIFDSNTRTGYKDRALSYGIKLFGFYYFVDEFDQSYDLSVTLKDYHGNVILNESIIFEYIEYNPDGGSLSLGYSSDELEEMLDLNTYVRPALARNITIFLVFDITIGATIHFLIKRKKR